MPTASSSRGVPGIGSRPQRARPGRTGGAEPGASGRRRGGDTPALLVVLQRRRELVELARQQLVQVVDGAWRTKGCSLLPISDVYQQLCGRTGGNRVEECVRAILRRGLRDA